jgi:predicted glycogen debranching enzyme
MQKVIRRISASGDEAVNARTLRTSEFLVTNGLGGYAAGTISGVVTRRYHGLLIAALPEPLGRTVMLSEVSEQVRVPDSSIVQISGESRAELITDRGGALDDFWLELGLPVWRYRVHDHVIEKRILLPHFQNSVHVTYRLVEGERLGLRLRPLMNFRPHEARVDAPLEGPCRVVATDGRYEVHGKNSYPPLRMRMYGPHATFTMDSRNISEVLYAVEEARGYEAAGDLWTPGYFWVDLDPGEEATLLTSTEPWEVIEATPPHYAQSAERERRRRLLRIADIPQDDSVAAELVVAADQFIIVPSGRIPQKVRADASGDELRTVIAGYHWFTDWGRDTMISLEGLTISTGRTDEAAWILRTFAHYVRDGLIPNMFPEGQSEGLYHTADATLWYFHAIERYVGATGDMETLRVLLPQMLEIIHRHLLGTKFGIGVDNEDGLLRQGAPGYQLTWMDAKVDDWVVTPRRGKAVEINALWYNALRLTERWLRAVAEDEQTEGHASHHLKLADDLGRSADQAYESFNRRFWYPEGGYLYDVIDGEDGSNDPACRPNQVLAIALDYPVLDPSYWHPVMQVVREKLVTPVGLRSLSPDHPDYKRKYFGDLRTRDAAYHQGTVWTWLIGPFIDAWLRVHPDDLQNARDFLKGCVAQLGSRDACIGSISEIFDAEPPYSPRGCVAQAWSVAEVLRCWRKTHDLAHREFGELRAEDRSSHRKVLDLVD